MFPEGILCDPDGAASASAFDRAVDSIANGTMPRVDLDAIAAQLSWEKISQKLEQAYYQTLNKS